MNKSINLSIPYSSYQLINIHTHRPGYTEGIFDLVNIQVSKNETPGKNDYYSIGWHPWDSNKQDAETIYNSIESAILEPKALALGECGLDRVCNVPFDMQKEVFQLHIDLASKHKKPLIIHCVKAYSELMEMLKKSMFNGKIVFHAYAGNKQITDQLLKYDSYFSFGYKLLKNDAKTNEIFQHLPSNRLFIETDEGNHPLLKLYQKGAILKSMDIEIFKNQIVTNLEKLFEPI